MDAFRRKVKEDHPDAGGNGGDMALLTEAKDLLVAALCGKNTCVQCSGRGTIKARLGSVECGKCHGEGIVY
jgi:hypothetical protein